MSNNIAEMAALSEFDELWELAERRIKRTERLVTKLTVPAVNELRYAGYHLLQAVRAPSPEAQPEHFAKAIKHVKRATYDAVEAEALMYLDFVKRFFERYPVVEVSGFDQLSVRKRARKARDLATEVDVSHKEDRDQYYERLLGVCDDLQKIADELEDVQAVVEARRNAQTELEAKTKAEEATVKAAAAAKELLNEKRASLRWRTTTIIAVVAALAACAKIAVDYSSRSPTKAASIPAPTPSHP